MPQEETGLRFELQNKSPVDLEDLTLGLRSLGEHYRKWLSTNADAPATDIRLYVKELKTGSIVSDLVALSPLALPFLENSVTIMNFCKHLHSAYDWLLGKRTTPDEELDAVDLQNLSNIVEPVAKDAAAQLNIGTVNVTFNGVVNITSIEANAAQNRVKRELASFKQAVTSNRESVLLYWYQARNDARSQAGDKAVIESIHKGPVKAVCMNESIKARMVRMDDNPFNKAFIVDVSVETVGGKPALYRILEVHEAIDKPQ